LKRQLFTCIEDDDRITDCCEWPPVCIVQGLLNRSAIGLIALQPTV